MSLRNELHKTLWVIEDVKHVSPNYFQKQNASSIYSLNNSL